MRPECQKFQQRALIHLDPRQMVRFTSKHQMMAVHGLIVESAQDLLQLTPRKQTFFIKIYMKDMFAFFMTAPADLHH